MLHLIPAPLHRAGLTVAHAVRIRWWRWRKPVLNGCRVLAFDSAERVLLIRHSYGSGRWMLPGGGIGRGETPLAAALRELLEETSCTLTDPHLFGMIEEPLHGTVNRVHLVTGTAGGTVQGDGREVIEAAFFAPDALPPDLSQLVQCYLADWVIAATAVRRGQSAPQ